MKHSHLRQIMEYMGRYRRISALYRTSDSTIKIVFDGHYALYFNMRRGSASIYMCDDFSRTKIYQAPFDVVLAKRFNRADVKSVALLNNDKILQIKTAQSSAYKEQFTTLQLEFTGKYTNAVILDEHNVVLEALRHIDESVSSRTVRVGEILENPPPPSYEPKEYPIEDVEAYLKAAHTELEAHELEALKRQKVTLLAKKLQKLQQRFSALEDENELLAYAAAMQHTGHVVLANMDKIKGYEQSFTLEDFDGSALKVELPKPLASASKIGDYFFKASKRAKQKALHVHIEQQSLREKVDHLRHFIRCVEEAASVAEVKLFFPEKGREKKSVRSESVETFWIEGYKIMLGKNERGNIELLQNARARDIWLHMKDRPSTHVIIVTDKQNVPEKVIETAAKLCVDFTVFEKGRYLVDYTPRREVKIQEGANVLYNKYKTILVEKG